MQSITYTNTRGTLDIGLTKPYILQRIEGISGLGADVISSKSPQQDGETYEASYMQKRNIVITGIIMAADYTTLNGLKRTVQNLFCPGISSTLSYTNETYTKECTVVSERSPIFSQGKQEKDRSYQVFIVSLIAHNPFFLDEDFTGETFSLSLGNFEFPWEIIADYEIETEGNNRVTLVNAGDVTTPVQIIFDGPATNPKITNETTGEFIEVTKVLLAGERLLIDTQFGNKSVIFDNGTTQTNAFSLIDLDSTFFQLEIGNNVISYSADFGVDTASVNIQYKNRFIGL